MFMKCYVDFSIVESQDELGTVMSSIQDMLDKEPIVMVIKADHQVLKDQDGNVCTHLFVK